VNTSLLYLRTELHVDNDRLKVPPRFIVPSALNACTCNRIFRDVRCQEGFSIFSLLSLTVSAASVTSCLRHFLEPVFLSITATNFSHLLLSFDMVFQDNVRSLVKDINIFYTKEVSHPTPFKPVPGANFSCHQGIRGFPEFLKVTGAVVS